MKKQHLCPVVLRVGKSKSLARHLGKAILLNHSMEEGIAWGDRECAGATLSPVSHKVTGAIVGALFS